MLRGPGKEGTWVRGWKISLRMGPWGPEPLMGMGRGEGVLCVLGRPRKAREGPVCVWSWM